MALAHDYDVAIVGAGPSGSLAATMLHAAGINVVVYERQHFPRFVIGESLLPQCMDILENADLLSVVQKAGFQRKEGAAFRRGAEYSAIDFSRQFSAGWGETFHVPRAEFDKILADEAAAKGVPIHYGIGVETVSLKPEMVELGLRNEDGRLEKVTCRFVLDASGFGRVLPRLLDLEKASDFPVREARFYHLRDQLADKDFDRNKILVTIHPTLPDVWYWLIPFANKTSSVGAVAPPEIWDNYVGGDDAKLAALIGEAPELDALVCDGEAIRKVGTIAGYSRDVTQMASSQFALLGNAGEFLDPIFSSGVTIAMKSANLAIDPLLRQLAGDKVDWQEDYVAPLRLGIDTFRAFVEAWYDGNLQDIILADIDDENPIKKMIVSILAGYAWDEKKRFYQRQSKIPQPPRKAV